MRLSFSLFGSLTILSLFSVACSSESTTGGAGGTGTGGDATSGGTGSTTGGTGNGVGGTGNATGGAGNGVGGTGTGTGGTGTDGSLGASVCPATLEVMEPVLTGKTLATVATAPGYPGGGNGFLEGPVWVDGALYVSHIREYANSNATAPAQIMKLNGSNLEVFIADAGTNGLALLGGTTVLAASQMAQGLVEYDFAAPATAPTERVTSYESKSFNSPNDLVIRADGNIYFTDPNYQCNGTACEQGTNRVYRVSPGGEVSTIPATGISIPNGIALSPDGNTLYVAGNGNLLQYPVMADGTVGASSQFAAVSGVDGMTVDCAGNLYATVHNQNNVSVYRPDGSLIGDLAVGSSVTNVAFGGADRKTLYVTTYTSREVKSVTLEVPGYPY